jgi:hypothetical protein
MCRMSGGMYRERFFVVLPIMVCVLLGACASGGMGTYAESSVADGADESSEAPSQVVVDNRSWDRVTVYVTESTVVWRLGEVEPMTRRTLPLKKVGRSLLGRTAQFIGRRLAGGAFRSESFGVNAGSGIPTWTIENQAGLSSVLFVER